MSKTTGDTGGDAGFRMAGASFSDSSHGRQNWGGVLMMEDLLDRPCFCLELCSRVR